MTFGTTEMEKGCNERGRIEVSLRGHCCSPYWHRNTPRDGFPGPTVSPVGTESKTDILLPSALDTLPGRLSWILHHGESLWKSVGLDHWGSGRWRKGAVSLGGSHSCLYQCPCGSTCHLQNLANGLYWQRNLFRDCTQAGKQIYSPFQLLSIAPSSVRTEGLTREPRQPWSPSYSQESSQQPFSLVEHSL